jgi:Protein of unknown function DUF262
MSENQTQFCKLEQIANWQLDVVNAQVGLPALQRGYVWKPKQVETLWDSLLRGFPIGSFLVSENESQESKKDLLDGQQRATAIAMGYYNPWNNNKHPHFFSNKFKNVEKTVPILWLDIGVKDDQGKGEKNDFLFLPRLITQSHPWGYNRSSEKLNLDNRRNAKKEFDNTLEKLKIENERYPQFTLKYVYPWIAEFPVPVVFLIEAINESKENWKEKLIEKCDKHLSHIRLKNSDEAINYITQLKEILSDINNTEKIKIGIERLNQAAIPIITLKRKQLEEEANNASADDSTLFVRINTLGTPLNGEELIYSIFKAVFPKSKEIVEDAGAGFIAPSRIIALISRIILTDIEFKEFPNREHRIPQQPTLKQFKEKIKDNDDPFFKGLKYFSEEDESRVKSLFTKVKYILIGDKDYQLPIPLAVDISKGNADVLFILLYWLHKANMNVDDILKHEELHKKILAAITALHWFALDTKKLLNNFSKNNLLINGKIEFWSSESFINTVNSETLNNGWITYLPKPDFVRSILERKINSNWEVVFDGNEEKKNQFLEFFYKLNWQRLMLLYVQRNYLNSKFKELQWDTLLEDTSRPYDWDHIYPDSWWPYYLPNLSPLTREWRESIGNFRALALEDNRSEGNRCFPKERLEKTRDISFITDNNWNFWRQIENEINEGQVEILAKAIVYRVVDIYEEWYNTLFVGELFDYEDKFAEKTI